MNKFGTEKYTREAFQRISQTIPSQSLDPPNFDRSQTVNLDWFRNGSSLPNYKRIINSLGNAVTDLDAARQFFVCSPGIMSGSWNDNIVTDSYHMINLNDIQNRYGSYPSIASQVTDQAVAQAVSAFNTKIRQKSSPFQGQVFLGELRETINLIKSPFDGARKLTESFLSKAKKSKSSRLKTAAKDIADQWLEFRFGILPLMSDINAIIDTVYELSLRKEVETFRSYGSSIAEYASYSTVVAQRDWAFSPFKFEHIIYDTVKVENFIRTGIMWDHLDQFDSLKSRFANEFSKPQELIPTAWELMPWSFLIDYFVNVGNILEASVTGGFSINYASNSIVTTHTFSTKSISASVNQAISATDRVISFSGSSATFTVRNVSRRGTFSAIPPIVFHLPGSNTRYANITALLISNFMKGH